jgi:hypothetical protein
MPGIVILIAAIHADLKQQVSGITQPVCVATAALCGLENESRKPTAGQAAARVILALDDPRPLAQAVLELEAQFGLLITYEDPAYAFKGDISDVTATVRRDLDKYQPGEAPRVLVPKGGRFVFSYDASQTHDPLNLLRQLVTAYHRDVGRQTSEWNNLTAHFTSYTSPSEVFRAKKF